MKKLIFSCLLLTSSSLFAQTEDETAIRHTMDMQIRAWNNGDIDAFMQTYWQSDSLLFVGSTGPTYGWRTTLEHYKKTYPDTAAMGKLSFNLLQLRPVATGYYFVLGEWHLKRTAGEVGGYFTLLFRKMNGRWLIVVDHTS